MSWKVGICICFSVVVLIAVVAVVLIYKGVFSSDGAFSVCYDGLGCFNKSEPFSDLPSPWSPQDVGIEFILYTPDDLGSNRISATKIPSTWRDDRKTVLLVHGFNSYPRKWYNAELRDAFLDFLPHYQVITVGWEKGAKFLVPTLEKYKNAVSNSRLVGALIAQLLSSISDSRQYSMSKVHCIGHSLGAHACGYAGKILTAENMTMERITGLDPAGPIFIDFPEDSRLTTTDAYFVDAIHTHMSAGLTDWLLDGGYGIDVAVGHVDFVANGDGLQRGCSTKRKKRSSGKPLIRLACSHERAVQYMTESIRSKCTFIADHCDNFADAKEAECKPCREDLGTCQEVGLESVFHKGRGVYLFKTTSKSPFC